MTLRILPVDDPRARQFPVEVLWCPNTAKDRNNGWEFPRRVERLLRSLTEGQIVLHMFGGLATFGTRLDIDPLVRPDVIGDAWLAPFKRDSFDVVILDPPYTTLCAQMKIALMRQAAWLARSRVFWFHTLWGAGYNVLKLERAWLVRVGDHCHVRALQSFIPKEPKLPPVSTFLRGPAVKYNRWLAGEQELPFDRPMMR